MVAVLIAATFFRTFDLALMEFRLDSAYWALEASRILAGGYWPLIGQQVGSVNVPMYNGPFMSYFTALGFVLGGLKPTAAAALVAVFNVLGILLTIELGRRLYSTQVGLIAGALMACAPWLVLYGRMLWPQALFPFLIPLSLLLLLSGLKRDSFWWYAIYGVALGVGLQLHLSVLAVIGTGALIILAYSRRRWPVIGFALGVALGYAPVLIYDLTHDFPNIRAFLQLPSLHATDESRLTHFAKTIWNFFNVLSGQALWVSKLSKVQYLPAILDWAQGLVFAGLFVGALALIVLQHIRGRPLRQWWSLAPNDAVVLALTLLPTAYLFFSRSLIQRHYFLFLYPLPFILLARGLELWQSRYVPIGRWPWLRWLAPGLLVMGLGLNLVTTVFGYRFLVETGGEGEYGTVLIEKQRAVAFIQSDSPGSVRVSLEMVQEVWPYEFLFQAAGLPWQPVARVADLCGGPDALGSFPAYAIVEPDYHDFILTGRDTTALELRSVTVIRRLCSP
jgi:4-amino-4-deoxy-L-arabinose transferase-like glycosyltransferase